MYEMKGALSGHTAPDHPVARAPRSRISPVASLPVQIARLPGRSASGRLMSQPLRFQSAGDPAF